MISEGRVVGPRPDEALQWRSEALATLAKGPPTLTETRLDDLRYDITDKLDDLKAQRRPEEVMAIAAALYAPLAELVLRTRGQWFGRSKWIPRLIARTDSELSSEFQNAFQALFRAANAAALVELCRRELQRVGGPLFDGFRREAVQSARTKEDAKAAGRAPFQVLVAPFRRLSSTIEYAILRRTDSLAWQWIAGGGDLGESPLEAAKREAFEEAGVPAHSRYYRLASMSHLPRTLFAAHKSWPREVYVIPEYAFAVDVGDCDIQLSAEHTDVQWCAYDKAASLLQWDSNRTALWELDQRVKDGQLIDGRD
jgi:dATP pyrophosphohydrolase